MIRKDLKEIDVHESEWYEEVYQSRSGGRGNYNLGVENRVELQSKVQATTQPTVKVVCDTCIRRGKVHN